MGAVPGFSTVSFALTLGLALTGTAEGERRAERRAEAEQALLQLQRGVGGVQSATARIRYLGEEAWASAMLTRALRQSFEDGQRRDLAQALSLLAARNAEPALLGLSADPDPILRMYALQGLARLRSRNIQPMLPLLADPSMPVRREAARALGRAGTPSVSKALLRAAKVEGDPEARAAMLVAVGESGDLKAAGKVEGFLKDSSESTRFAAARALCLLGAPAGLAFARRLLGSEDRHERRNALSLFEGAAAKRVERELRPLLQGEDLRLAAAAARILYQGGDRTLLEWLVMASYRASGVDKLAIEAELEPLHLADADRRKILTRNGVP